MQAQFSGSALESWIFFENQLSFLWLQCPNLSAGRGGVPDSVGHIGKNGDEPALTIKFLSETSTDAAEQSSQQVVITGAKLTVQQVVLQKPDANTQQHPHTTDQRVQA